jgi:hypothetical protein
MTELPTEEAGVPQRTRLVVGALAALAIAAVVVLIAAAHVTPVGQGQVATGGTSQTGRNRLPTLAPQPSPSQTQQNNRKPNVAPFVVVFLIGGLAAVLAGIMIIMYLLQTALRRRALPRLRLKSGDFAEPGPTIALRVGSALDRALSELGAGGPVDDAIIRCWVQLEDAASQAGLPRIASDTPEEAVGRMLALGGVRADPLRALADLYREARFSRHPMTAADAEAARAALTSIVDDLRTSDLEPADGASRAAQ